MSLYLLYFHYSQMYEYKYSVHVLTVHRAATTLLHTFIVKDWFISYLYRFIPNIKFSSTCKLFVLIRSTVCFNSLYLIHWCIDVATSV